MLLKYNLSTYKIFLIDGKVKYILLKIIGSVPNLIRKINFSSSNHDYNVFNYVSTFIFDSTTEMYRSHKDSSILDHDGKIFRTRRIFRQWKSKFEEINQELKLKLAAMVKYG